MQCTLTVRERYTSIVRWIRPANERLGGVTEPKVEAIDQRKRNERESESQAQKLDLKKNRGALES